LSATTKIKQLSALFALLSSLYHPVPPSLDPPTVTILCYHTVDAHVKTPFTIDSRKFNEQMRYLWIQKIPVIPLSRLTEYLQGKTTLPERAVVITIDDGYKTANDIAWPILKRYGFPVTLYVYPYAVSHLRGSLTWEQVRQLSAQGVDIESHSFTHPLLTHPGKPMNKKDYELFVEHELVDSKKRLEQEIGHPVTSLAYPYGGYSEFIMERTHAAGYQTALTCDDGDVAVYTDPLRLNRRLVFRQTSPKAFVQYFRAKPIRLADLSPRDGERVKDIPKEIQARIVNPGQIQLETAQILVDKVGGRWRPIAIDVKTGLMRFPVPAAASRRGYYFVSLVAKDHTDPTLQREASWLFIVRRNVSKK
jgi:peptidoglycan/xylan/chitin deacetylase (PgdA/CDA1 family)